jgi:glucose-6-phosphate-specific signal transduction histidine kinase
MSQWLDWINVPIYEHQHGRLRIRITRIDVLLVVFGVICVGWYGYTSGWQGALLGGLFYVMVLMMALWLF